MTPIRVLIAEDHETVRHGLRLLVDAQEDMEVVAEAPDGQVALQRARALQPDIVILDLSMPDHEWSGCSPGDEGRVTAEPRSSR